MGLIKFFGKQALKRFKNSVDELNQALNEIDMENVEARFNELKEDFNKEFDKWVRNLLWKFHMIEIHKNYHLKWKMVSLLL